MAKIKKAMIKLMIRARQASPAPPIGPSLGQYGVNIMDFCNRFNERTKDKGDDLIPVVLTVYKDNSFDFILKKPPTSFLLKKAAGILKGSSEPNREKVATVTLEQVKNIAKMKFDNLHNEEELEKAIKVIEGTANSMGILVEKDMVEKDMVEKDINEKK